MSERFTFRTIKGKHNINLNGAYNIFDNGEILDVIDVVDRLNEYEEVRVILLRLNHELYELNNKLKEDLEFSTRTEIAHHKVIEDELRKENEKLQCKYDHLLWLYNGLGCKYDWLKDENKQLKDLIIHLGYTIKYDDRHISLELKE